MEKWANRQDFPSLIPRNWYFSEHAERAEWRNVIGDDVVGGASAVVFVPPAR
jgi:hypothetical protein